MIGEVNEPQNRLLIHLYVGFNLFGLLGTAIMALTAIFSRSTPRHATWLNFAFSWIVSAVSYTLLFFSGQLEKPEPDFGVCLAQAALVYAAPPLYAKFKLESFLC